MGAITKNAISQLMPVANQNASRLFFKDPTSSIRIMGLEEAQHVSRFVPVLVLMPASPSDGEYDVPQISGQESPERVTGKSKFLELFKGAVPQLVAKSQAHDLEFGDVKVNFSSMLASRQNQQVSLTLMEFKTLKYFAQNEGRVISRDELLKKVWGYENYPCTRTVDNHILKLRQKLERNPNRPIHIRTVHGVGYRFTP
jgi:DNA-binding winged helix-turn-helix (wHTH) protein